ncbi:MAG: TerB family tellurite resistance protein [Hyphomicrobiaceae bacterium]
MAILLALLGAIAAVAVLLWRLHIASAVARDAIEVADDARSFLRRLGWSRKARRHPLDLVEDPREAAAAMMVALAMYDGPLTAVEHAAISGELVDNLAVTSREAEILLQRGRWLAGQGGDLGQTLRRLTRPMQKHLNAHERRELIAMLHIAAGPGAAPDTVPGHAIKRLEDMLLKTEVE